MSIFLQPILVPVNGAPDIVLSTDPKSPDEVFVFLGMALLEKVPHLREDPAFKMLLARLHNGGVSGQRLTDRFGVARSTLRRWGRALKSGSLDRIRDAFSGQGATRKVTPEIESYVRDRFRDLHDECRDYNKVIRTEVERYFKQSLSSERLRWIFKDEREKLGKAPGAIQMRRSWRPTLIRPATGISRMAVERIVAREVTETLLLVLFGRRLATIRSTRCRAAVVSCPSIRPYAIMLGYC